MHSVKNQIQCWGFVSILIIFRVLLADVPLKSESHESENDPIMTPTGNLNSPPDWTWNVTPVSWTICLIKILATFPLADISKNPDLGNIFGRMTSAGNPKSFQRQRNLPDLIPDTSLFSAGSVRQRITADTSPEEVVKSAGFNINGSRIMIDG